jgi:integrase
MPYNRMRKTRYAGVYKRDDGRFVVRVSARTEEGKAVQRTRLLPEETTIEGAVRASFVMKEMVQDEAQCTLVGQQTTRIPRLRDIDRDPSGTVEAYTRQWFSIRRKRLKPSTEARYEEVLNQRILPRVGYLMLMEVCRTAIESWVVWAEAQRKPDGNPFAKDTLKGWWRLFSMLMKDLAADYDIPDPTRRIRPPHSDVSGLRESRTLTELQLDEFLTAVQTYSPDRYAEVITVAVTGMRPAEVYALMWDCVDFENESIVARRSVSLGQLTESTKTHAPRVVPMPPVLVGVLREHLQRLIREQHPGVDSGFVFPADNGKMRLPQSAAKVYELVNEALSHDIIVGPQVLRRTMNTLLVKAGVDRIILRAMMGHTSEAMTQRYAGIDLKDKHDAIRRLFPPGSHESK